GTLVKTVDGTTLSTTMSKLTPSTAYGFYVNARDAAGNVSQASNTVNVTTTQVDTTPPTAPANLRTTAVTANSVKLASDASQCDFGVAGYTVYAGTTQVGTSATAATTIYGLPPETSRTYTVKAVDAAGNASPLSAPVTAVTRRGHDPVGQVTQVAADD